VKGNNQRINRKKRKKNDSGTNLEKGHKPSEEVGPIGGKRAQVKKLSKRSNRLPSGKKPGLSPPQLGGEKKKREMGKRVRSQGTAEMQPKEKQHLFREGVGTHTGGKEGAGKEKDAAGQQWSGAGRGVETEPLSPEREILGEGDSLTVCGGGRGRHIDRDQILLLPQRVGLKEKTAELTSTGTKGPGGSKWAGKNDPTLKKKVKNRTRDQVEPGEQKKKRKNLAKLSPSPP